jgi:hypothetical protein
VLDRTNMGISGRLWWFQTALCIGIMYLVVGLASGTLANRASSTQMRVRWRLAAWLTSAAVFAAHVAYERLRLRSSSGSASFHTSLAVAFAAFMLAVAATVRAGSGGGADHRYALALVAWPAVTAVPAFVVALALSAALRPGGRAPS